MEETFHKEEGVSLMDILRLLLSKIKLLILIVLIGGFLGGAFAVWRTWGIDYYGTVEPIEFYVNPENPTEIEGESSQYSVYGAYGRHVMDNMVKLLSSESFAEKLMLNGATLPDTKDNWVNKDNKAEVSLDLEAKVAEAEQYIAEAEAAKAALKTASDEVDVALEALQTAWEKAVCDLAVYKDVSYSDAAYEKLLPTIKAANTGANAQYVLALESAYETYSNEVEDEKATKENEKAAKDKAEAYTEIALEAWRTTKKYATELAKYSSAVTYSYLEEDADIEDANNLARSFIYVEISVLNDKDFANELYERVIHVVPAYVEDNMTVPAGYTGTNCQRITRTDAPDLTNRYYTTTEAIKFALIFAAVALVIACIAVIIIDKSDKRLRDYEVISKKFNVPVLGVVPTIEPLTAESSAKKKSVKLPKNDNDTEVQ